MNEPNQPIGILLAAGRGRRMGRTKQLLPWPTDQGELPLVAASFDALSQHCSAMVVVVGHEAEAVAAALAPRKFIQMAADPEAQMIESIRTGIRVAAEIDQSAVLLIHPADHPFCPPQIIDQLWSAHCLTLSIAIIPEWQGRGGHPVLVPAYLRDTILGYQGPDGLKGLFRAHPDCCQRVRVDDQRCVQDLDTPEDYKKRQPTC